MSDPAAPAVPAKEEQINIKVQNAEGAEVFFKIKKGTPLRKLMEAYCQRQAINPATVRFLFEGKRVNAEQTPNDFNMDNDDVIDVMIEQTGGSSY